MSDAGEIASLIRTLCKPSSPERVAAAAAIFARGCELARVPVDKWLADAQLAPCLIRDRAGFADTSVGIAVSPETFDRIRAVCGSPPLADVPPDQDAKEFELDFDGGVRLDILTTREPGGPGAISKYLQKFGEGIQQVELSVRDADRATEILRRRFSLEPIYPATRAGANGTRVNFFLVPVDGKKILIELVEEKRQNP